MDKLNCSVYEASEKIEELISDGALLPLYVSGSSMNPFLISRRDIVYLKSVDNAIVKKRSIVLFKRNDGTLVLHRVRKIFSDGRLKINGDAQTWSENIEKNQIVAIATEIERKGKRKSVDSFHWKLIDFIWSVLFPLRSVIMRIWFKIRRIKNKG